MTTHLSSPSNIGGTQKAFSHWHHSKQWSKLFETWLEFVGKTRMAHTYYKDRLGFEPEYESRLQQSSSQHQTSVTKSTLYSSGISQSSTQQRSSNYQTKATVHEASHSASASSNNHYSSSRIQHGSSENHSSGALESTQHSTSGGAGHGVYEENLTKFKGPEKYFFDNLFIE